MFVLVIVGGFPVYGCFIGLALLVWDWCMRRFVDCILFKIPLVVC